MHRKNSIILVSYSDARVLLNEQHIFPYYFTILGYDLHVRAGVDWFGGSENPKTVRCEDSKNTDPLLTWTIIFFSTRTGFVEIYFAGSLWCWLGTFWMEVLQSSEVKEKVQRSCLFLVISILKEYFPFSRMVALDHLVIKLDPTPRPPRFNRKMPWEKGIRISGSVAKLSNDEISRSDRWFWMYSFGNLKCW